MALFNKDLLDSLNFDDLEGISFNPVISPSDPGDDLILRPLQKNDYNKGFMECLSQLTKVGTVSQEQFEERFDAMIASPDTYFVFVIEDIRTEKVISSTTVLIENKFIRGCAKRGRIEDVVVDDAYRGRQLGKLMVLTAKKLARELGCYKLTLECEKDKIPFYNKFGLSNDECFFMVHRY